MKLETGKYYLGSDGKKYGPLVPEGSDFHDNGEMIWKYHGEGYDSPDLIAEWTFNQGLTNTAAGMGDALHEAHFCHMLSGLQGVAAEYGYTISNVTTNEGPVMVDFKEMQ